MDGNLTINKRSEKTPMVDRIRAEGKVEGLAEACLEAWAQVRAQAKDAKVSRHERIRTQVWAQTLALEWAEAWEQVQAMAKGEKGSLIERLKAEIAARSFDAAVVEARAKAMRKGRIDATASAVLRVLKARDIKVSVADKKRILACHRLKTLEAWHLKSVNVTLVDELFD